MLLIKEREVLTKVVLATGVVVVGLVGEENGVMIEMLRGSRRRRGARHDVEGWKVEGGKWKDDRRICR